MSEPTMTVDADGTKEWKLNGELHRTDGPAYEWDDGTKVWYVHGKAHRTDGPAIEYSDGSKEWRLNGEVHRVDGPAIEWANGKKVWWLNNKKVTATTVFWAAAQAGNAAACDNIVEKYYEELSK